MYCCGYSGCGSSGYAPSGCGSAGYSAAGSCSYQPAQYSALENSVSESYPVLMSSSEQMLQESREILLQQYANSGEDYSGRSAANYHAAHFSAGMLLRDVPTRIVNANDSLQAELALSLSKLAFEAAAGKQMPGDISIRICTLGEMKRIHAAFNGEWNSCISGFSINRKGFGMSEIFVREGELARLMLTIGHEIGHVLTFPLPDAVDEEAKAFAFSLAWMDAIRKNNIGGLSCAIMPIPARNGLHDRAFDFLAAQLMLGKSAADFHREIASSEISISRTAERFDWR